MQHFDITVTGRVQGVFFRASAQEVAEGLGIHGNVCNHADGSVRLAAEGDEAKLQEFVDWLQRGPERARVKRVDVKQGELQHYKYFIISG
tara:strand:+ start:9596 stop:9865 length:270 start_codon:yes stop_codon:yes gene_type:complete